MSSVPFSLARQQKKPCPAGCIVEFHKTQSVLAQYGVACNALKQFESSMIASECDRDQFGYDKLTGRAASKFLVLICRWTASLEALIGDQR